jgi:hypothetical protein
MILAAFVYVSALGHEWAHDVHAREERAHDFPSLSNANGARAASITATALYGLAALLGALFFKTSHAPSSFAILLGLATAIVAILCTRLILLPCERRAEPFYVAGMAFWMLPLIALIVERMR